MPNSEMNNTSIKNIIFNIKLSVNIKLSIIVKKERKGEKY